MRNFLLTTAFSIGIGMALVGCSDGTLGGPGTTGGTTVDRAETFALDTPAFDTAVAPGGTEEFKVAVNRGSEMDQQITLRFSGLPDGVTISPPVPTIMPQKNEAVLTLVAAPDAPLGEYTITVVGQPTQGANAVAEMDIKVDQTNK